MTNVTNVTTRTTVKHAQVVTPRSTEHSWHASVTCHKIDQTKFAVMQVRSAMASPSVSDLERVKGRSVVVKLRAECLFHW